MKQVLLIEDDLWLGASYQRGLEAFSVRQVLTPYGAVRAIDEMLPDVIICDILLQEGNAFDIIHFLAGYTDTYRIPVILLSTIMKEIQPQLGGYDIFAALDKTTMTVQDLRATVEAACAR